MSITPPLHTCSSVPVADFASRTGDETKLRMPNAESWRRINQGSHSECWGQLVNLRVPSSMTRETEKGTSGFVHLLDGHKRPFWRRRSQNIGRVTVPNELVMDTANGLEMDHSDQQDKPNYSMGECSNLNSDDKSLSFNPEFDEEKEFDWIPSVKPCTEEELRELKNKYSLVEEIKKESERKKRKQRAHLRGSDVSCLTQDKYKCLKQHKNSENKGLNVSISHDNRHKRTLLKKSPLTVALLTEGSGKSQIFREAVTRNQTR